MSAGLVGPGVCQLGAVQRRPVALGAITEPIDKQKVDDFVLPGIRRGVILLPTWQVQSC